MKIFIGKIISKKMDKTVTVAVERIIAHPIYKKRIKRVKKYQVHDEENKGIVGQAVRFVATAPISKSKRWKLVEQEKPKEEKSKRTAKKKGAK